MEQNQEAQMQSVAQVRYLTSEELSFYRTEGGLLGARLSGEDLGRIALMCLFPLHDARHYLAVRREVREREDRYGEIGIIADMDDFPADQVALMQEELDRRYFVPVITATNAAKEEFGHTFWDVETTAGNRTFSMSDLNNNVLSLGEGRVLLIDMDGNRYLIPDIEQAGEKARRQLDIWI